MRSKARRTTAGAAIAVVAAALAGCTPPVPALTAARVLQSVSVAVSSDGGVRAIEGTALGVGDDPSQWIPGTPRHAAPDPSFRRLRGEA